MVIISARDIFSSNSSEKPNRPLLSFSFRQPRIQIIRLLQLHMIPQLVRQRPPDPFHANLLCEVFQLLHGISFCTAAVNGED